VCFVFLPYSLGKFWTFGWWAEGFHHGRDESRKQATKFMKVCVCMQVWDHVQGVLRELSACFLACFEHELRYNTAMIIIWRTTRKEMDEKTHCGKCVF
jgi:hypothetical protein